MTLEELLRTKVKSKNKDYQDVEISPDFRVAVQNMTDAGVHVIVHPDGYDSETLDFVVSGNELTPL
jgi:hypothetical protein